MDDTSDNRLKKPVDSDIGVLPPELERLGELLRRGKTVVFSDSGEDSPVDSTESVRRAYAAAMADAVVRKRRIPLVAYGAILAAAAAVALWLGVGLMHDPAPQPVSAAFKAETGRSAMRSAVRSPVEALCPRGNTLSTHPDVVWTGPVERECELAMEEVAREGAGQTFPAIRRTGGRIAWGETEWPELRRGGEYSLTIKAAGSAGTGETVAVRVLPEEEAVALDGAVGRIEADQSNDAAARYIMAKMLSAEPYSCFAEARIIGIELLKQSPDNADYLRLLADCYAGMGMPEAEAAVKSRMDGVAE